MKLARSLSPTRFHRARAALLAVGAGLLACRLSWPAADASREQSRPLRVRLPDLSSPVADGIPRADAQPVDPLKAAVLARINRDRASAGVLPVRWDEAVSRIADAFCRQQVRERTSGHFLMDGVPPYGRTGLFGVFGAQSENSASWITSARSFREKPQELAIAGHEGMMAERPPADGHRRTILDPEATHVGVGYAVEGGRFQMAQEFLARNLDRLVLSRRDRSPLVLRFEGKPSPNWRLEFVTIAREPLPTPLTRQEANGRTSYSYPKPGLALVAEGNTRMRVSDLDTEDRVRVWSNREFSFVFEPRQSGLYTFLFYTAVRSSEAARPGGSATVWVE
jgi:uncharacterized protein YkwD